MLKKQTILKYFDNTLGRLAVSIWAPVQPKDNILKVPRRVLFIRPGGIGDATLLIPTIQIFTQHFPDCAVDVLAEKRNVHVFDFCQEITNVYCYDLPSDWLKIWRNHYDVVIDTEQWHRLSALFGWLLGGRCVIGFDTNERRRLLSHAIGYETNCYEALNFLSLLVPCGIEIPEKIDTPFLTLAKEVKGRIIELLAEVSSGLFVVLCPGGSRPEKSWSIAKFAELASKLHNAGLYCVVLGGPDDLADASRVAEAGQGLCLAGRTSLFESALVLKQSRLVVANDTGLLHLAVGLARPTVGLFGPSNACKWAPCGELDRVISLNLACSPCSHFGAMPECPSGWHCLSGIDVDTVFTEVMALYREVDI
jgi:lipopolysaccharide heptosyltransferase II